MMTAYFIYNESHKVEINERVLQISERVRRSKLKLKMEKKAGGNWATRRSNGIQLTK